MKRLTLILALLLPTLVFAQGGTPSGGYGPGGSSSSASPTIGAIFSVLNYGWIDDDATDNCGAPATNFMAAVNGYTGAGIAQALIPEGTAGKAYKLNSCNLVFTIPTTIMLRGTLDCGTGVTTTGCVILGPTNLVNFTNAQTVPYTLEGTGAITGCVNVTVACVIGSLWVSQPRIRGIHATNVGAGNASPPACTNYFISFEGHNNAPQIIDTSFWNTDATTGRCWSINNRTSASGGTNSALIEHNTIIGAGNAPNFLTPCGSVGHKELGAATIIKGNQIYGFGQTVLLLNPVQSTMIEGNQLDQSGCTTNVASADIQYGDASNGAVVTLSVVGSYFSGGAGHATNAISVANGSTSTLTNLTFIGNTTVNGITKNPFVSTLNCLGACYAYGNPGFTAPTGVINSNLNAGTVTVPVYPLSADGSTGIYSTSSQAIDFASLGVNSAEIGSTFIWVKNANGLAVGAASNSWLSAPSSGNFTLGTAAQGKQGKLSLSVVSSDGGAACTNGELALSAGFGTTAGVTAVAGTGQTCHWTITSNGTGQAANPTITDTLTNTLPSASTVCEMRMEGGTGTATLINQTTLSATAPVFTFNGTPVAASTYVVVRRCGP